MKKIRPPFKIHGGKYYLSKWVISNFPSNYKELTYCEPCCGAGSVFLNKVKSREEIVGDVDKGIINIFKSLRDAPTEFIQLLKSIEYSESVFQDAIRRIAGGASDDYVNDAINEYVVRRMSRGGMRRSFSWSNRLRGGKPGDLNAWESMLDQLPWIADRVQDTVMLNSDCIDMLDRWNDPTVLVYLDPPYLKDTRTSPSVYTHEMTVEQHTELLAKIRESKSKVIISGYPSPLYNKYLKGWRMETKTMANHSGQQKVKEKRVEVLWMNY